VDVTRSREPGFGNCLGVFRESLIVAPGLPAYNQRQYRSKSGERISDEMERIYRDYDVRMFCGSDAGSRPHCKIRWGTQESNLQNHQALDFFCFPIGDREADAPRPLIIPVSPPR